MTIEKAMKILRAVDGIECKFPGYTTALGIAMFALEKQMPKGTWTAENSRPKSFMFVCSLCKKKAYDRPYGSAKRISQKVCKLAYCPNCGAKMEV